MNALFRVLEFVTGIIPYIARVTWDFLKSEEILILLNNIKQSLWVLFVICLIVFLVRRLFSMIKSLKTEKQKEETEGTTMAKIRQWWMMNCPIWAIKDEDLRNALLDEKEEYEERLRIIKIRSDIKKSEEGTL